MSTQTDLGRRWKIIVRMLRLPFSICSIVATLAYMQPASSDRSSFLHPGCQLRGKGKFSVLGTGILLTAQVILRFHSVSSICFVAYFPKQTTSSFLPPLLPSRKVPSDTPFNSLIYTADIIWESVDLLLLLAPCPCEVTCEFESGSRTSGLVYFCQTYFSLTQAASLLMPCFKDGCVPLRINIFLQWVKMEAVLIIAMVIHSM